MEKTINTDKRFLFSLTKKPYATNLSELNYLIENLSHLSHKKLTLVQDFYISFYKELINNAIEYGLFKVFEVGFSIFDLNHALIYLSNKSDFKLTKEEQTKLMEDCDEVANWITNNYEPESIHECLAHDSYHDLRSLYSTLKKMETKD